MFRSIIKYLLEISFTSRFTNEMPFKVQALGYHNINYYQLKVDFFSMCRLLQ